MSVDEPDAGSGRRVLSEALMRCQRCDRGDRVAVRRAKPAQLHHRAAVVLDVPTEECPACGDDWLRWLVAGRLDENLGEMLEAFGAPMLRPPRHTR